jgi:hypothetical protein
VPTTGKQYPLYIVSAGLLLAPLAIYAFLLLLVAQLVLPLVLPLAPVGLVEGVRAALGLPERQREQEGAAPRGGRAASPAAPAPGS